jgi:hypothetical protein
LHDPDLSASLCRKEETLLMTHSLLEPEPIPPPNPWPKRIILAAVVLALVAAVLYWQFRYYREERLVRSFMDSLQAGD